MAEDSLLRARVGGCSARRVAYGGRNCLRINAETGRFEWAPRGFCPITAAKRRFLPRAQRGDRDFRREAAVAIRRAARWSTLGACGGCFASVREAGDSPPAMGDVGILGVWVGGCSSRWFVYGGARLFPDPMWKSGVLNGCAAPLFSSPPRSGGFFPHHREAAAIPPPSLWRN